MPKTSETIKEQEAINGLEHGLVKRLISISLIFGLVGGAAGGYLMAKYLPGIGVDKRAVVLQDSSAVIDVIKKVSPSVVSITAETQVSSFFFGATSESSAGTGIILTDDGLILTNKHVAASDQARYTVITADGKQYKNAKVVARDPLNDIAFLRVDAHGLKAAEIGDSSTVVVGQRVIAIGNALGQFQNTATEGIVSGLGRPVEAGDQQNSESLTNLIQTDAAINPGNSGGPLINISGQVIGLNTAVAGGAQNVGFSIPINEVRSDIVSVRDKGKLVRPYLGVRFADITPQLASQENLPVTEGALLTGDQANPAVIAGGPADKAGLKDGDIITKVAGTKVDKTNSLTALVGQHQVGDKITLTVLRGNKELSVDVTLEEAK